MNKLQNSILYTTPLKNIPKGLIYKGPKNNAYHLVNTETGEYVGKMYAYTRDCTNSAYYSVEPNGKTFHIYSFEIYDQLKGWGKYLADFAKKESYKQGCKGRTSLVAFNSEKSPHVFWKKQGFVTKNKKTNELLDHYIKTGVSPCYMPAEDMFLPIEKYLKKTKHPKRESQKPTTFIGKVANFLVRILEAL